MYISTLGPYATTYEDFEEPPARAALESAGFRRLGDTLGVVHAEGLCVYYFGRRGPLTVRQLLFYWQD
ncbi:hypothetical protein [Yinghuangia seranimata]|uniref:hypothetical protein n=1 Tax=Yinghuangia seranimata TaxID=408067 RepID=UPI00248B626C|nr:hypothetical protein [Yinghuangia seranimata]MDI2129070.1 hypothetical protein [Yinghuangia seranimata]